MSELQKLKSAAESVAQNPVVWAYIEALEAEIKRLTVASNAELMVEHQAGKMNAACRGRMPATGDRGHPRPQDAGNCGALHGAGWLGDSGAVGYRPAGETQHEKEG